MINFLNRYSPRLAELSTTLRELCRIHADYNPKSEHHKSFNAIKRELSTNIVLPYYDPTSHTTLQTDSTKKGLGAVFIQNGTPIYFTSRAISTTETNYQNLKQETLATIWGMEKFHYFLYGNEFTLETDQKPLVSIYHKHLINVSPRIKRLITQALPYNFHIIYILGKQISMANALLRNLKISEDKEENQELHPYWNYRDEISMEDRILLKAHRILIPHTLCMEMLDLIHQGHQEIKKCLLCSRESLFWPGITDEIHQTVNKCSICQSTSTT